VDESADDFTPPLPPDQREEVLGDIEDLEVFQAVLGPRGVLGVVVACDECDTAHYLSWDLLRSNLRHLLDSGRTAVHEPAYAPDPMRYVSWDYAQGYVDGVMEATSE
jgi:hypothetical protein